MITQLPCTGHMTDTLMVRAWDLYNNSSVAKINFVVEPGYLPDIFEFNIEGMPVVSGEASELVVTHNRPQSEIEVVLELFSIQGQALWKNVERVVCDGMEYRYSWNGTAQDGRPLTTGVYVIRVYIVSDSGISEPKNLKLVIVNNKK